jgi:hypothetical protein
LQITAGPLIVPGVEGVLVGATASVTVAPVPQPFVAATVILPDVVPIVALMLFVMDVPDQPVGSVQV